MPVSGRPVGKFEGSGILRHRLRCAPVRFKAVVLILAFSLFLLSCEARPGLTPLPPDAVVLAFGDSLTYGTGVPPEQSYPAVLETLIGRKVVREGVPGEVTAEGVARLPKLLDEYHPRLLLLCEGGNDFLRRMDERQTADNLRTMVRLARERGVEVVLIGVPQPGLFPEPPPFFRDLAREAGLPYEGKVLTKVEKDRGLKSDAIHPNGEGYRLMAEAVASLMRKSGAL